jgi:hypothetical protein
MSIAWNTHRVLDDAKIIRNECLIMPTSYLSIVCLLTDRKAHKVHDGIYPLEEELASRNPKEVPRCLQTVDAFTWYVEGNSS